MSETIQNTIKRLEHLSLKDGDVLAIEFRERVKPEHYDLLAAAIRRITGAKVLIIAMDAMTDIRTLDEGAMRAHGWVRASAVDKPVPTGGVAKAPVLAIIGNGEPPEVVVPLAAMPQLLKEGEPG